MKKVMAMKGMKAGPTPKPKMTGKPVPANENLRKKKQAMAKAVGNVKMEVGGGRGNNVSPKRPPNNPNPRANPRKY